MFMQFFNIFIIIVAFILINIYYCQVYIAQIMKLDVIFFRFGGKYLPSHYRAAFIYARPCKDTQRSYYWGGSAMGAMASK